MWRWALALAVVAGGGGLAACYFLSRDDQPVVPVNNNNQSVAEEADILPEPAIYEAKGRKVGLEAFHAEAANMFAQTPGFGMERMPVFMRKATEHVVFLSPGDLEKESSYSKEPALQKANEDYGKFFATSKIGPPGQPFAFRFEGLPRGYIVTPVSKEAQEEAEKKKEPVNVQTTWSVAKVDLVGLIEADNPVVYDSYKILMSHRAHLNPKTGDIEPKKDDGKKFEPGPSGKLLPKNARVPDFFEITGIERLQKGESLFVRHNDNTSIRMLGALRATSQCLKCHEDFKEGDLLGALSYTLRKIN